MRDLAFISVDTNGPDPGYHRIREFRAVRVNPTLLTVESEHGGVFQFQNATWPPGAGGEPEEHYASPEALRTATIALNGCVLAGHDVHRDWAFVRDAFRLEERPLPDIDERAVDTLSFAWPLVHSGVISQPTLEALAGELALKADGSCLGESKARLAFEVYRTLTRRIPLQLLTRLASFQGDEMAILTAIARRMHEGRGEYGAWEVTDERDYPVETMEEVFDALNYCAATLVRQQRAR